MNNDRRQEALRVRIEAAKLAAGRVHPRHEANGDEQKFRRKNKDGKNEPSYLASFTKGLPHDHHTGLIKNPEDFQQFVKGIDSGDPRDFRDTPLGPEGFPCTCTECACEKKEESIKDKKDGDPDETSSQENPPSCRCGENKKQENQCLCLWKSENGKTKNKVRAWESQGGGNTFDLEGPDAWAVTMPPAPALGSDELTAEMAEVYAQALLRDVPFTKIVDGSGKILDESVTVQNVIDKLSELEWFKEEKSDRDDLSPEERSRKRKMTLKKAFRGITPGDDIGPYISQFLLVGNKGLFDAHDPKEGRISYGSVTIDQRVRIAQEGDDYMTTWDEWFDVQNGADLRGLEKYRGKSLDEHKKKYRFITTPRDLATYVHYDALYEAYLNACLILLGDKVPFDPGIPFQGPDFRDHQQGFAHFGGPHILSLVTEVATRALKAVRYQKFNVHRRMRPEVLAARLARYGSLKAVDGELDKEKYNALNIDDLNDMIKASGLDELLQMVATKNGSGDPILGAHNYLLPMAFPEGSPMHPSYGAGHATVAGACVTILKAFFDHGHELRFKDKQGKTVLAYEPDETKNGTELKAVEEERLSRPLTVEGELNKLASNIAIGRDWAGVHYFSDYIESLRMGEQIALGILEEQKLTYGENFSMTVPLYDGGSVRI